MKSKPEIAEQKVSQSTSRVYEYNSTTKSSVISNVGIGDKLIGTNEKKRGRKKGQKDKKPRKRG